MKRIELPSNNLVMYAFGECHLENRNMRLLEIEETLLVDVDWINLQVRSVFRKATLDLLFQLRISPSRHVNAKYHQNWLRASMNTIVEMNVILSC
nr:hypothetical protein [Tanacetum cinerariifolium]